MRLNKYIAQSGYCSRRKADELTEQGKVKINGAVCKTMGYDVQDGDVVTVEGTQIGEAEKHVYYALNKPVGYVTTTSDEKDRPTAVSLLTDVTARVFPVGRLDYNSCGLLLLTNDGDFSNHIAHPRNETYKTYLAVANKVLSKDEVWALRKGVNIGGYVTKPAEVNVISEKQSRPIYEVKICEGRNRQVRKMFEAVGARVLELQRTAIGDIQLGRLREGTYRKLTAQEIEYLKKI